MRRIAASVAIVVALLAPAACAIGSPGGYAGYSTPSDALSTFFVSARNADYAKTYEAYYGHYHDLVAKDEFVSHRAQASRLTAYRVDSLAARGDSAVATVTLTFAPAGGGGATRTTTVREDLVREAGGWKIRVW